MTDIQTIIKGENPSANLKNYLLGLIKANDAAKYKDAFDYLIEQRILPEITNDAVNEVAKTVKSLSSDLKPDFMFPLLKYIESFNAFQNLYQELRAIFISACEETKKYYDLAKFYDGEPYDLDSHGEWEQLEHFLLIGETYLKAHYKDNAYACLNKALKYIFRLRTPKQYLERFDALRAGVSVERGDFLLASQSYYQLSTYTRNNPQRPLHLAIVYGILAPPSMPRNNHFARMLANEKTESVPISNLLKIFTQNKLITGEKINEIENELKNEHCFDKAKLDLSIQTHNLECISKLFSSISLDRLSQLIGCKVDEVIDRMSLVQSKTVETIIDQPSKMVLFRSLIPKSEIKDRSIEKYCKTVSQIAGKLPK
ncbi:COP9 signalosome complex subunit 4 [Histomonas meleagridis]|uniref:COP9 signalosome complex subunit 4 n=1 Tax=Histomonas meleagridis TaxID=135588 RepID=UPI0035598728|nr:COP9 signalosome complex subunit 4 [Histomonas meleagridis]KAH0801391.1 COP9 signalosome complex subunit 4 [Histomonas meleagridis]